MTLQSGLRQPLFHFIVVGALLFCLQSALLPTPKILLEPVSAQRVEALRQQWVRLTGRAPDKQQLMRMRQAEQDNDMLLKEAIRRELHLDDKLVYQRLLQNMRFLGIDHNLPDQKRYENALQMGLHLRDEVIKRRLVQRMENELLMDGPIVEVTEQHVRQRFAQQQASARQPARYSIKHVFFLSEHEAKFNDMVSGIEKNTLKPEQAAQYSSPFLAGYEFAAQSAEQLTRQFGQDFVRALLETDLKPQHWYGPLRSTFGWHYVWVDDVQPERAKSLEEMRSTLRYELERDARQERLRIEIDKLRQQYEVLESSRGESLFVK